MKLTRLGVVHAVDVWVVFALLLTVLLGPVGFLVPFNDEWLRTNYLADTNFGPAKM